MVGGSIALMLLSLGLLGVVGPNSFSEGLLYSAFPASLMLSSECTYLRRYSGAARAVISVAGAVLVIFTTWAAVVVANMI